MSPLERSGGPALRLRGQGADYSTIFYQESIAFFEVQEGLQIFVATLCLQVLTSQFGYATMEKRRHRHGYRIFH